MGKYNWAKIKAKYETGNFTLKEIADKYKCNYKYLCRKANREGWSNEKGRQQVENKVYKKIVEEEADKEFNLRNEYGKIIKNIRRATANELFNNKTNFERLKQLKISTEIIRNCRSEDWELNEIKEVAKKIEQEFTGDISVVDRQELIEKYLNDE